MNPWFQHSALSIICKRSLFFNFQEIILKRAADLLEAVCFNIPRTPTQIHTSQYPPTGNQPPNSSNGNHPMMIGQHLTTITPDGLNNGGPYVTITNPDGTSVVYGGSNQQRIPSSTDVNNNDVAISSSGYAYDFIARRFFSVSLRL